MTRKRPKARNARAAAAPNKLPRTSSTAVRPRPKGGLTASEPAHILAVRARVHGKDPDATKASLILDPVMQSASTVGAFTDCGGDDRGRDLAALIFEIDQHVCAVATGKLARPEAMLVSQAHALDTIFATLARRAAANAKSGLYLEACERYLRLALKAQSQCRATLETLALIKNPASVTFMRQANIGQAVQVNNAPQSDASSGSRAREKTEIANELLEAKDGRLDQCKAGTSGKADSTLETVGAINGPENASR
jgi:hypothetical protein